MSNIVLHPLLLAWYPILFFYAFNMRELRLGVLAWPLAICLLCVATLWGLVYAWLRSARRSGILVSVLLLLFFTYGHLADVLSRITIPGQSGVSLPADALLGPLYALAVVAAIVFVRKERQLEVPATALLNVAALFLVGLSVYTIVRGEMRRRPVTDALAQDRSPAGSTEGAHGWKGEGPPRDIYFIVPDRYADNRTLRDLYGYDNSEFLDYLQGRGFQVIAPGRCNYGATHFSLPATLNLEYLDALAADVGPDHQDLGPLYDRIRTNRVETFLRGQGYRHFNVGAEWGATGLDRDADRNFHYSRGRSLMNCFHRKLLEKTALRPLLKRTLDSREIHRQAALYQFDTLPTIPALPGPKYVFVHLLMPHEPYVFDADGADVSELEERNRSPIVNYLNHLQYTNRRLRETIDAILDAPGPQPLILILADEGPHPILGKKHGAWAQADDTAVLEKLRTLNAYYLPGLPADKLPPGITPVNAFRFVFNEYFGTDYEMLPDRSYLPRSQDTPYQFREVTALVDGGANPGP